MMQGRVRSYFAVEPEKKSITDIIGLISKCLGNGQTKAIPLNSISDIKLPDFYKLSLMNYSCDHSFYSYFFDYFEEEKDEEDISKSFLVIEEDYEGKFKKYIIAKKYYQEGI